MKKTSELSERVFEMPMVAAVFVAVFGLLRPAAFRQLASAPRSRFAPPVASADSGVEEVDVVVIGSGLGGLSCGALLASRGLEVAVLEQHYEIGGCAHSFAVGLDGRTVPSVRLDGLLRSALRPLHVHSDPRSHKFTPCPHLHSNRIRVLPFAPNPRRAWRASPRRPCSTLRLGRRSMPASPRSDHRTPWLTSSRHSDSRSIRHDYT